MEELHPALQVSIEASANVYKLQWPGKLYQILGRGLLFWLREMTFCRVGSCY